jgi:Polyketide cyclase / dehydrase and lipid transport
MSTVTTTVSSRIGVPRDALFARFIPIELPRILHRHGPVPAVIATSGQTGPWDRPGSRRTVLLGDGSTAREEVTLCEAPARFGYRVAEFSGPVRHVASEARGRWWFAEAGPDATDVRWQYTFVARSALARLALAPVVRIAWRRYMAAALARLAAEVATPRP